MKSSQGQGLGGLRDIWGLGIPLWGIPRIRTIEFWSLYWGPPLQYEIKASLYEGSYRATGRVPSTLNPRH